MFWPDDIDADLDLWVKGPNDGPVGYSKPSGMVFNYGCRGLTGTMPLNYEISFTRGITPENIKPMFIYSSMTPIDQKYKQLFLLAW